MQTRSITECKIKEGQKLKLSTLCERGKGDIFGLRGGVNGLCPSESENVICLSVYVYLCIMHMCVHIGAVCTWKPKVDGYLLP